MGPDQLLALAVERLARASVLMGKLPRSADLDDAFHQILTAKAEIEQQIKKDLEKWQQ